MTDALTNNSRVTLDVSNRTAQAKILLTASEDGNYGGYAIIKCGNLTLTTPVIFSRKPFLKLNFKEEYYFLENPGIINVPIEKSISTLDCDFTFNNTFKNTNIEVSSDPELMFSYDYQREETQNIDANYSCQTDEATIQKEYSFISNYYKVPPFSYFILNNKIPSGKKGILSITNTFKDNITIKLAWEQTTAVYPVVDSISLMPEQTVDLYIYQKLKITENRTEDNNLIISSKGYEQKVPFTMQLGVGYLELPSEYKIRNKIQWKYIILGIVVLLLLGIILFVGRFIFTRIQINKKNKLKEIEAQKEKETKKQKETSGMPEVIKTAPKPKQNKQMLELLMAINSSIGESDQQIIDELKKENYREEEINELLKKLKKSISDKEVNKNVSAAGVEEVKPTTTEVKK
jgi:hypothetical protein